MDQVQSGKIVNLNKDRAFGFIKPEGKTDRADNVFFHKNNMIDFKFEDLELNNIVEFAIKDTEKGLNAINVVVR